MFKKVELELKFFAKLVFILGIIGAAVILFVGIRTGVYKIALWAPISLVGVYFSACLIYGFAELIESTKEIKHILEADKVPKI